jgi:hypothetical protein
MSSKNCTIGISISENRIIASWDSTHLVSHNFTSKTDLDEGKISFIYFLNKSTLLGESRTKLDTSLTVENNFFIDNTLHAFIKVRFRRCDAQ